VPVLHIRFADIGNISHKFAVCDGITIFSDQTGIIRFNTPFSLGWRERNATARVKCYYSQVSTSPVTEFL